MTVLLDDLIAETTASTGTGTVSLDGNQTGFKKFLDVHGDGDRVGYAIFVPGGDFERGIGRIIDGTPDTLTRDVVLVSSNGDTGLVDFAAGTKQVTGSFQTGVASQVAGIGLVRAHRNAVNQTGVVDSTWTKVQHTTEDRDDQGWFDNVTNYRYQPTLQGAYHVAAYAMINSTNTGAGDLLRQRILMNGSTAKLQTNDRMHQATTQSWVPLVGVIEMNGDTDYIEHEVEIQGAAGNVEILGGSTLTYFTAWRIA